MRIEILSSPSCPNAAAAKETVAACLATLGLEVPIIERVGRYPSPTILVDGADVMRPEDGAPTGDACRLDLPTRRRVLDALQGRRSSRVQPSPPSTESPASHQSEAPQSVAAFAEQLPPAIRELHRAVLRGFRDSGGVHRDDLNPTAAALGINLDDALHQLGRADLVHTSPDGQIDIAYPFSCQPTGHRVQLTGHPGPRAVLSR